MIRPWEVEAESYSYETRWYTTANCVNEVIGDESSSWKRGDIVRFGSGFWGSNTYKDWFFNDEDKSQNLRRDPRVPLYAINQYAILMTRYRVVKQKHGYTFRDYGNHLMMLSGPKIGRLRRYYTYHPYIQCGGFPYQHITDGTRDMLTSLGADRIINSIFLKYGNTPESRTMFVAALQDKINEEQI